MVLEPAVSGLQRPPIARTLLVIVAALLIALLLPTARPATAAQTITLAPVADTYVRIDNPTTNYGTGTKLFVDAAPVTNTYLKFDLTPAGSDQIDSATLRLRSTTTTNDGGTLAPVTNDAWQESAVTWNSAPVAESVPVVSIGPVTAASWVSVDVTRLLGGDPVQSFRITSSSATAATYISRNGSASLRPQLVVVTSPTIDVTSPSVAISQPSEGAVIGGSVNVMVDASDNVAVTSVEATLDGASIGTDVSPPFAIPLSTLGFANGTHVLQAKAVDRAGNVGTSTAVSVTIANTPDGQSPSPPTMLLAAPVSSSQVDLAWTAASDNVGVDHYRVLRDGVQVATVTNTVYSDRALSPSTVYTYTVVAVDAVGNESILSNSASATTLVTSSSFTFAAAGDHGSGAIAAASLGTLDASAAEFYLALGDLDYNTLNPDSDWCQFVKDHLPTKGPQFPVELVSGNHEQQGGPDGYILNHAACLPDRLGSVVGPGSVYGAEYYFDYPAAHPLMRVVMLPSSLTIEGTKYSYGVGSPHRDWLTSTIDQARAAGIPWVTVGMHYQCITTSGRTSCTMGPGLWNLLLDKHVDLILTGHEHSYQRSKQLSLNPTSCLSMSANIFEAGCIVDDGSDGQYQKGAGSVNVIAGTFGQSLTAVNPLDAEAPYFARIDASTYGFVQYTVTRERIDARFVPALGTATDAFSIVGGVAAGG